MKIFYTASYLGKQKYQANYNQVLAAIEATGSEVISPEKGNYQSLLTAAEIDELKYPKNIHYEAIRKGILWSDAVIIEITNEDFQLGHEATLAIQNKKYVLCLSLFEDFSDKIQNRYFYGAKYNEYNIEEIVENFIKTVQDDQFSERFNLFLSSSQTQFLEKKATENKMNKSEYLRFLLDKDMKSISAR